MKKFLYLSFIFLTFISCKKDNDNNTTTVTVLSIGDLYAGGIVFQVSGNGTSGMVARTEDSGIMNHYEAMDLESNGWFVPSISQLETMYFAIGQGADNIGNFADGSYWSSTYVGPSNNRSASKFNFANGNSSSGWNPILNFRVRLIKSF